MRALEQRDILETRLRKTATKAAENSSQIAVGLLNVEKYAYEIFYSFYIKL
jgi:hypothetical protein